MSGIVLAVGAHPDDIEFMMAGTFLHLVEKNWEGHVLVVANGCLGSAVTDGEETKRIRYAEAKEAAESMGARFHSPVVNDLEIFYELPLLRKICAVVRETQPDIILTHSPSEYMEDHETTCRLTVSAAFCRGMQNFDTDPSMPIMEKNVTLYHSLPYGLRDPLNRPVVPDFYVNTAATVERKKEALACHRSQKEWLDQSQGIDSYIHSMFDMSRRMGKNSGNFEHAEGWIRHNPLGFCGEKDHPLEQALGAELIAQVDGF
jgi:LmbE family N-acetylglucosaminyl deacetylase